MTSGIECAVCGELAEYVWKGVPYCRDCKPSFARPIKKGRYVGR